MKKLEKIMKIIAIVLICVLCILVSITEKTTTKNKNCIENFETIKHYPMKMYDPISK